MAYTEEYWLAHYEYSMGYSIEKPENDNSNVDWTRGNIEKVLRDEFPHGMTGTTGAKALIAYLNKYHPKRIQSVTKMMIDYIESVRTKEKPLLKLHTYYTSMLEETGN